MRAWLLPIGVIVITGAAAVSFVARGHEEPPVVEAAPEPTALATPQVIVVDVVGAVARPGVVHLPAGDCKVVGIFGALDNRLGRAINMAFAGKFNQDTAGLCISLRNTP